MIEAKVIASTVNEFHSESVITTIEVTAPRFLLAEVNTHGLLAKSAASSRAIPVHKRINMVRSAPFVPLSFGKNRPGMQATEELNPEQSSKAREIWLRAAQNACIEAEALADLEVHKQTANRLLEPFVYYKGVITATEWDNFFKLRLSPEAQPEFEALASAMQAAMKGFPPSPGFFHLPYVPHDSKLTIHESIRVSAARCARISYTTFDGKMSTYEEDLELCERLISSGHMSPFEHVAEADTVVPAPKYHNRGTGERNFQWAAPHQHGRFWGWMAARNEIEKVPARRNSFALINFS